MKLYRYLLAALIYALPTAAFAQCSGIFPAAGAICGHTTSGAGGIARPLTTLPTGVQNNITRLGTLATDVFVNRNATVSPSAPSQAPYQLRITAADGDHAQIALQSFGSDGALSGYAASGTAAAPTALTSGSTILNITAKGWDGAAWGNAGVGNGNIGILAAETQAPGAHGSFIQFGTTPIGSTTRAEVGRFTPSGGLAVGHTTDTTAGVVNPLTGFRINGSATSGNVLRGNGTSFVSAQLGFGDLASGGTAPAHTLGGTITGNGQTVSGLLLMSSDAYGMIGTGGAGFMGMAGQSSNPSGAPGANALRWFANATGNPAWQKSDTFTRNLLSTLTADRNWTFPDASGTIALTAGATIPTVAQGDLLYGSATNTLSSLAKDTNATRYLANTGTTNNPAWSQVNLANGVTGTLPAGNGGTGITALGTGVTTALGTNVGSAGAFLTNSGAMIVSRSSVDMNSTADQAIPIVLPTGYTRYAIFRVWFSNPSISLTTAVGGVYTAASKGGTAVVAASQAYSALTTNTIGAAGSLLNTTITNSVTAYYNASTLYVSLSTPQGSAATADVTVIIHPLP